MSALSQPGRETAVSDTRREAQMRGLTARVEGLAVEMADLILLEDAAREINDFRALYGPFTSPPPRMLEELATVIERIDTRRNAQ